MGTQAPEPSAQGPFGDGVVNRRPAVALGPDRLRVARFSAEAAVLMIGGTIAGVFHRPAVLLILAVMLIPALVVVERRVARNRLIFLDANSTAPATQKPQRHLTPIQVLGLTLTLLALALLIWAAVARSWPLFFAACAVSALNLGVRFLSRQRV
jgi:hypothetical protein